VRRGSAQPPSFRRHGGKAEGLTYEFCKKKGVQAYWMGDGLLDTGTRRLKSKSTGFVSYRAQRRGRRGVTKKKGVGQRLLPAMTGHTVRKYQDQMSTGDGERSTLTER